MMKLKKYKPYKNIQLLPKRKMGPLKKRFQKNLLIWAPWEDTENWTETRQVHYKQNYNLRIHHHQADGLDLFKHRLPQK